jgi:hypothetical protein
MNKTSPKARKLPAKKARADRANEQDSMWRPFARLNEQDMDGWRKSANTHFAPSAAVTKRESFSGSWAASKKFRTHFDDAPVH